MPRSISLVPPRPAAPAPAPQDPRVPLRLTVARGVLGLELYEPVELGPVEVFPLAVSLPNLRFPVDLSGGVKLFRHRRGRLERLGLTLHLDALSRWLERRLREAPLRLVRPPSVWRVPDGIGVGLVGADRALAFDLLWAPLEADARFVVARPRGAELGGTALMMALHAVDSAVGHLAERRGRFVTFKALGGTLARTVLPAIGARAPSVAQVRCSALFDEPEMARVELDRTLPPPPVSDAVLGAIELATLTLNADDALARGDVDAARAGYVAALEHAPRQPEICRLVAEIDVLAGGRAEAALGLLSDAGLASESGTVGALLLARVGDLDGARAALRDANRDEEYAPVASLLYRRLAALEPDAASRLAALDLAVARCPGLADVRFTRLEARAGVGDVEGALSDAEHIEASASMSRARYDVLIRAATVLLGAGYVRDAGRVFERALRYVPDDAGATAGLARALLESGRADRAAALLERAVALGESAGTPQAEALIDLAKILAKSGDLPQAIARARQVAAPSPCVIEARALEADYRRKLGDLAGASLAHARVRELVELGQVGDVTLAVDWLRSAARFEGDERDDPQAAERHLAVALRLAPRDARLGEEYREAAAKAAARAKG